MASLPPWLKNVKETLPGWLDRIRHRDGPGRYRFAVEAYEPYDLDSSCMVHGIVCAMGGRHAPDAAGRRAWIDYLCGLQRPEDGLIIDPGMEKHIIAAGALPTDKETANVRGWTTRNALNTILELGGRPRYQLRSNETFREKKEMAAYLEGLDWHNPWGAGSWAGAAIVFQDVNRRMGNPRADALVQAAVEWLKARQSPENGAWSDGGKIPLHRLINGIFKVWIQVLPVADLPVQYPERVIDLCIKGMREDPALVERTDACSIFDVALVLDTALRRTDHRRAEVSELCRAYLPKFEPMLRPDGAFSYGPKKSLAAHGGLALAPVKDQSDVAGSALHSHALALLANLCGFRNELGWTPVTEWRMRLA